MNSARYTEQDYIKFSHSLISDVHLHRSSPMYPQIPDSRAHDAINAIASSNWLEKKILEVFITPTKTRRIGGKSDQYGIEKNPIGY